MDESSLVETIARTFHTALVGWLGAYISALGLMVSIYAAIKARTAAQAASQARDELHKFDAVVALSDIVRRMDDLKAFHRQGITSGLPERYSAVRLLLVDIKRRTPGLSTAQRDHIQLAVQFLHEMESHVDKRSTVPDARSNGILNTHTDRLVDLLNQLRP
jgi:hypothetical protein